MRRFFIDPHQINNQQATITGPEARHLSLVLRLKIGDIIELLDGTGITYLAEIQSLDKFQTSARIISERKVPNNPPFLSLAPALIKGKKMDLIIQKACELGVSTVHPFISDNCVLKKVKPNMLERWQRIAHESCKQCGRPTPMQIKECIDFSCLITQNNLPEKKIIFWEEEKDQQLANIEKLFPITSLLITTGPEGGFTKQEIALARKNYFSSISLGPRVLRSETAVITAVSIIQFLLGNLNKSE